MVGSVTRVAIQAPAVDLLSTANKALRRVIIARGAESLTTQVRRMSVHHYRVAGRGSGPPVLLLHGLGGSANGFYKTFFPLAEHFRSIHAIDLPGNGFSPLPKTGAAPIEEQVNLVLDFLKQVVGEPVLLVGNSLGGAMSLYAASEQPDAVRALALVSPAGAKVSPERIGQLVKDLDVKTPAEARALTRRLFHKVPLTLDLFASQLRYLYASEAVKGFLTELKTSSDFVPSDRFEKLVMPVMLVWGQSEKLLPYEGIEYFRAWLPKHAEIHEVPMFGHVPQMERPRELVGMLVDFARRNQLIE